MGGAGADSGTSLVVNVAVGCQRSGDECQKQPRKKISGGGRAPVTPSSCIQSTIFRVTPEEGATSRMQVSLCTCGVQCHLSDTTDLTCCIHCSRWQPAYCLWRRGLVSNMKTEISRAQPDRCLRWRSKQRMRLRAWIVRSLYMPLAVLRRCTSVRTR